MDADERLRLAIEKQWVRFPERPPRGYSVCGTCGKHYFTDNIIKCARCEKSEQARKKYERR